MIKIINKKILENDTLVSEDWGIEVYHDNQFPHSIIPNQSMRLSNDEMLELKMQINNSI